MVFIDCEQYTFALYTKPIDRFRTTFRGVGSGAVSRNMIVSPNPNAARMRGAERARPIYSGVHVKRAQLTQTRRRSYIRGYLAIGVWHVSKNNEQKYIVEGVRRSFHANMNEIRTGRIGTEYKKTGRQTSREK